MTEDSLTLRRGVTFFGGKGKVEERSRSLTTLYKTSGRKRCHRVVEGRSERSYLLFHHEEGGKILRPALGKSPQGRGGRSGTGLFQQVRDRGESGLVPSPPREKKRRRKPGRCIFLSRRCPPSNRRKKEEEERGDEADFTSYCRR